MYATTIKSAALVAILAIVLGPGIASGEMLLSDNFDRPDSGDVYDHTAVPPPAGQGGTLSPLDYVEDRVGIKNNRLRSLSSTGGSTSWAVPDHNFVDSAITDVGGFVFEFDVNPDIAGNGTSGYWAAVSFGHSYATATTANEMVFIRANTPFGFLLRDSGIATAYQAGVACTDVECTPQTDLYHVKITVTETDSFAAGELGKVTVNVDGADIYSDLTVDWTGANYINLEAYTSGYTSEYDNLEIYTIPEPSTLVLLASVAGLMILWRRRTVA